MDLTTPWWEIILRTAVVYVVVLVLLRSAGKRELGQMSPVDLVVILEMGYVSSDDDRALMLDRADLVANSIADGIMKFLNDTPRSQIFGHDLVVPAFPSRPSRPSPTP